MKQLIFHQQIRYLFVLFILAVLFAMAVHADLAKNAAAAESVGHLSGESNHFSPVIESEKMLAEQINRKREANHAVPLDMDWDLFRFSRFEAKDLSSGKIRSIDESKLARVIAESGRQALNIRSLTVRVPPGGQFPDPSWWQNRNVQALLNLDSIHLLGTGHAKGTAGEYWVILYASDQ